MLLLHDITIASVVCRLYGLACSPKNFLSDVDIGLVHTAQDVGNISRVDALGSIKTEARDTEAEHIVDICGLSRTHIIRLTSKAKDQREKSVKH
jgi:hypothetical protein